MLSVHINIYAKLDSESNKQDSETYAMLGAVLDNLEVLSETTIPCRNIDSESSQFPLSSAADNSDILMILMMTK